MFHEPPSHDLEEASPELHARCRVWSKAVLGLKEDANADEINRGLWKCLEEHDLIPSEGMRAAFRYLREVVDEKTSSAIPVEFVERQEARIEQEIESFAEEMFDLDLETRGSRWETLRDRADGLPEASWRLDSLLPGLKLDPAAIVAKDEDVATLAKHMCGLFAARILDKPVWRRRIRELWKWDPERVSKTAKRLQDAYLRFAELDSPLVHELIKSTELSHLSEIEPIRFAHRVVPRRRARKPRVVASESNNSPLLLMFVAIVFFAAIGRFVGQDRQPSHPEPRLPSLPSFDPPRTSVDLDEVRESLQRIFEGVREESPAPGGDANGLAAPPFESEVIDPLIMPTVTTGPMETTGPMGATDGAGPPPSKGEGIDTLEVLKHLERNP